MECPKFRSKAAPDISLEPERRVDGQGNDYLLTKFGFAVCHISLCPRCSYCTVHSSTNISLHKRVGNIIKYRWDTTSAASTQATSSRVNLSTICSIVGRSNGFVVQQFWMRFHLSFSIAGLNSRSGRLPFRIRRLI